MGEYHKCPNCSNDNVNETIYNCRSCGFVYCKACDDEDNGACPECGSDEWEETGYIIGGHQGDGDGDIDDNEFDHCPRCNNVEDGAPIYRCNKCKCLSCQNCDNEYSECPNCGSIDYENVGWISHDCN